MSDYYAPAETVLPLFAKPAPAQQHSITSMRAADSLDATTLNRLHRQVLAFLEARPDGATDEEMQAGLGMNPSTQRPRRGELEDAGLIVKSGVRLTASRRRAAVWRAAK